MNKGIKITDFESKYRQIFKSLNLAWLEKYFEVEPIDDLVLSDPEKYIIEKGGFIFFAENNDQIVGTVALIKMENKTFELSKMAVDESYQGLGIGKILMQHCFDFAKKNEAQSIILYSNTTLESAIHLYFKMGFIELPVNQDLYKRANIKMEKVL